MSDGMYYEKPVLLDREKHRRRRVKPSDSFAFARKANSLFLAGVEFAEACKEYAIVFTRQGGRVLPVVMLGLRARENLFIDGKNHWRGRYVPAFLRRYPFVLAQLPGQQELGLCVDEAFAGWNETQGEALFDAQGHDTPFLRNAAEFLMQYQREHQRTEAFCQRLVQAGLLREMNARADLKDGRSFTVEGVMVVDEPKLLALPDAAVLPLFRAGDLHLISLHLMSLSNMKGLVDKMAERQEPLKPPPKPAKAAKTA
jgi:hypothetical protein